MLRCQQLSHILQSKKVPFGWLWLSSYSKHKNHTLTVDIQRSPFPPYHAPAGHLLPKSREWNMDHPNPSESQNLSPAGAGLINRRVVQEFCHLPKEGEPLMNSRHSIIRNKAVDAFMEVRAGLWLGVDVIESVVPFISEPFRSDLTRLLEREKAVDERVKQLLAGINFDDQLVFQLAS